MPVHKLWLKTSDQECETFQLVGEALKAQIIQAVLDTYINQLKDLIFNCANISAQAILEHLQTTCGTVSNEDLIENEKKMKAPWSPEQPVEDIWKQVHKAHAFTEGHDPISKAAGIHAAIENLKNSGVFTNAINDWDKKLSQ